MTTHEKALKSAEATPVEIAPFAVGHSAHLRVQLLTECEAMAGYGLSNGIEVEPSTIGSFNKLAAMDKAAGLPDEAMKELAGIHQTLAKAVYPAIPRTIVLLDEQRRNHPFLYFLGPVPLIRRLSAAAIGFLLLLLMVSLDPDVNVENINLGLLSSSNHQLFMNQVFLLCAAGLGASFSAVFKANDFIAKTTYDPCHDSSYWSRIILGLISGIIIVELLPSSLFDEGTMKSFGKPSLAMLGGFSASVVYRMLQRLVESMETLVKGSGSDNQEKQRALQQVKASEQRTQLNADTAARLVSLQKDVEGLNGAEASKKINGIVKDLLSGDKRSVS